MSDDNVVDITSIKGNQTIPGTNIPADPRKRTKNHARLEITIWAEFSDELLATGRFKDAVSAMRVMEDGVKGEIGEAIDLFSNVPIIGEATFSVQTRVSK